MKKRDIGSSFDSWLREEGIYDETAATAIRRVLARQGEAAMKEQDSQEWKQRPVRGARTAE